ncbi:ABC transporter ATP-binding protein [Campylobacter sp. MIT 99-7217]|uniref:AAA family ATPase n=1 Tax=Campylobacter sp. MIT 99-7217 TaxID=535091 RepID=UPI00115BA54E|nr:AAA family ATPase [Campylobacter sp. MIT 99-7217]TQR33728.1 ABC transporter ATP-binding protein [Campylobacter sp. MIT 99-7217]
MQLELKDMGAIKEGLVELDGLCVIAGYNDEGKSTVGKVLMALIKAHNISKQKEKKIGENISKEKEFGKIFRLLFDDNFTDKSSIKIQKEGNILYDVQMDGNSCKKFTSEKNEYLDCTFIQSPFVWDLFDFFRQVRLLNDSAEIYEQRESIRYPYILWDLYQKIQANPLKAYDGLKELKKDITELIRGNFMRDEEKYKFIRNEQEISLRNVATGIKQFGILQALINNNRLTPNGFLIFDEPENHLHPMWQLKFAEFLVRLCQKQIPILINTHSPYMVEALHKYSLKYKVKSNFHLASKGEIKQHKHNEKTIGLIFEKLNQPFETFDELDKENGRS